MALGKGFLSGGKFMSLSSSYHYRATVGGGGGGGISILGAAKKAAP